MKKLIMFDLDGTLLPMDEEVFAKAYFKELCRKMAPHGYDPQLLVSTLWEGTAAMVRNDGTRTNEEAFWEIFCKNFSAEVKERDYPLFEQFYLNEFANARSSCGFAEEAAEVIRMCENAGKRIILATNPIFPAAATKARIGWAGLRPEQFEWITTYENSCHAKPDPEYYRDLLKKAGVEGNECVMIGNDAREDLAAAEAGIDVFILTDCLINRNLTDLEKIPHGSWDDLKEYLNSVF